MCILFLFLLSLLSTYICYTSILELCITVPLLVQSLLVILLNLKYISFIVTPIVILLSYPNSDSFHQSKYYCVNIFLISDFAAFKLLIMVLQAVMLLMPTLYLSYLYHSSSLLLQSVILFIISLPLLDEILDSEVNFQLNFLILIQYVSFDSFLTLTCIDH